MNGAGTSRHAPPASPASAFSPLRKCAGECGKRRSYKQFEGARTVCIRCARRNS